jgi:hypothetical protein
MLDRPRWIADGAALAAAASSAPSAVSDSVTKTFQDANAAASNAKQKSPPL